MGVLHPQQALETHKPHTGVQPDVFVHALNLTLKDPSSTGNAGSGLCISGSTLPVLPSLPRDDISAWNWDHRAGPLSSTSSKFCCPSQHPSSAKPEVQCQTSWCEPISRVTAPFGGGGATLWLWLGEGDARKPRHGECIRVLGLLMEWWKISSAENENPEKIMYFVAIKVGLFLFPFSVGLFCFLP